MATQELVFPTRPSWTRGASRRPRAAAARPWCGCGDSRLVHAQLSNMPNQTTPISFFSLFVMYVLARAAA